MNRAYNHFNSGCTTAVLLLIFFSTILPTDWSIIFTHVLPYCLRVKRLWKHQNTTYFEMKVKACPVFRGCSDLVTWFVSMEGTSRQKSMYLAFILILFFFIHGRMFTCTCLAFILIRPYSLSLIVCMRVNHVMALLCSLIPVLFKNIFLTLKHRLLAAIPFQLSNHILILIILSYFLHINVF